MGAAGNPSISLATVYRNLNCLAQSGELRKIHVAVGADRFDGQTHRHSHLVCRSCGEMSDLDPKVMGSISEDIRQATGFLPSEDDIVIYGVCENAVNIKKGENSMKELKEAKQKRT